MNILVCLTLSTWLTVTSTAAIDTAMSTVICSMFYPVSRFIKYTGYGNAAGLLAARGLLRGGRDSGIYSEDEDSETEEYREAKAQSVPQIH